MSGPPPTPRAARANVELVTPSGEALGSCPVAEAHRAPGRLHRAFSVFWSDGSERLLLQRRAWHKSRFPGLWSNACCSHPAPGDDLLGSAAARLDEELGLRDAQLGRVGVFTYRAGDPATGFVEHEYDHVLLGQGGCPADVDPAEVSEWRWVRLPALRDELADRAEEFTPWLAQALGVLTSASTVR